VLGVKWFSGKACPIGIDFGAESLKMAQLTREDGPDKPRVLAAGRKQVPESVAGDPVGRGKFFAEAIRELLNKHPFRGRRVIACIPSESLFIQHIRVAKMSEADLVKALPWEAQGKLPFPARDAVLRHLVAGELFVDNETRNEVILMAAPRQAVESHLSAVARAKLDVQAVLVPPLAVLEAFRFLFTRAEERDLCSLFVDIGASHTCAMITHATKIVFVKQIATAGNTINEAVATRLNCSRQDARQMRLAEVSSATCQVPEEVASAMCQVTSAKSQGAPDTCQVPEQVTSAKSQGAPEGHSDLAVDARHSALEAACREETERLARELTFCARYYQSMYPDRPLQRVIFLGGEAHHRSICQQIARQLRLPGQLGDPMLRMHRTHQGRECGDLTGGVPCPEWAVAFGCSLSETVVSG